MRALPDIISAWQTARISTLRRSAPTKGIVLSCPFVLRLGLLIQHAYARQNM